MPHVVVHGRHVGIAHLILESLLQLHLALLLELRLHYMEHFAVHHLFVHFVLGLVSVLRALEADEAEAFGLLIGLVLPSGLVLGVVLLHHDFARGDLSVPAEQLLEVAVSDFLVQVLYVQIPLRNFGLHLLLHHHVVLLNLYLAVRFAQCFCHV